MANSGYGKPRVNRFVSEEGIMVENEEQYDSILDFFDVLMFLEVLPVNQIDVLSDMIIGTYGDNYTKCRKCHEHMSACSCCPCCSGSRSPSGELCHYCTEESQADKKNDSDRDIELEG